VAIRLLAVREHCRRELRRKLEKHPFDPDLLEQVLDRLQQSGLQSDERFTEAFVAGRVCKGQGPLRIRAELRERGVGSELIGRYLDRYQEAWFDLLRQVHDAKYGPGRGGGGERELAKRARFLEYRGFPREMIREFLLD